MNETAFDLVPVIPAAHTDLSTVLMTVVGVVLLICVAAMVIVLRRYITRPDLHGLSRDEIRLRWIEIEKVAATGQMGVKMAIVEADTLLDSALKSMTIPGQTLGERLKFAGYRYPELRKVWSAHRMRNQIVHESSFEVSSSQGRYALSEYRKALKVLHVL
jgi:hypothetical protein